MYKVALNTLGSKNKRQRNSLMNTSFGLFSKAVEKNFKHSFYYLGEMFEKGDSPEGTNLKRAIELYEKGGALEDGRCLFQLALL
jgi:TPR repeat protein